MPDETLDLQYERNGGIAHIPAVKASARRGEDSEIAMRIKLYPIAIFTTTSLSVPPLLRKISTFIYLN